MKNSFSVHITYFLKYILIYYIFLTSICIKVTYKNRSFVKYIVQYAKKYLFFGYLLLINNKTSAIVYKY